MFSWWSSLGPEEAQRVDKSSENAPREDDKTSCKTEGDVDTLKIDENEKEQSKSSELDYAKDMAKNVGSKWFSHVDSIRWTQDTTSWA